MMKKADKDFLLDGMTWSFSRVSAYNTCPRMFYYTYLQPQPQTENAFAEWGSLCHSLFERYYKEEIPFYDMARVYEEEYDDAVGSPFLSTKMEESYYNNGLDYFEHFEDEYSDYHVIGVEKQIDTKIGRFAFTGYIDLLLQDDDGHYFVVDFKSKSKFKSEEEKSHYAIQLYLYARWVQEQYGEYPQWMEFNMFRARKRERVPFVLADLKAADQWFLDTIQRIYDDDVFDVTSTAGDFFCNNLCSLGYMCPYSKHYEGDESNADRQGVDP